MTTPGKVEAENDQAYRRTRAGQLQYEPKQGDDGELIPKIRDAQSYPEPLERGLVRWRSANKSGSRHELMILQSAFVLNQ